MGTVAIKIIEAPHRRAICETRMRYIVMLNGKEYGEIYFNMTGYCGYLPLPDGSRMSVGECGISQIKREAAAINREFRETR